MGWKFPLTFIPNGSVTSSKLADLAVTTAKLADNAATQAKIALAAVGTPQLVDQAVAAGKIALLAVGTTQLANGAVDTGKIADLAVATAKLADAAVATAKIADGSVATNKIANAAITNALIANLAVGTANIQIAAITTALIANLAVTNAQIADLAADKITAGTITATIELLAATVTGGLLRTAASGRRVEISGAADDRVNFYSGGVDETAPGVVLVDSTGYALRLKAPVQSSGVGATPQIEMANGVSGITESSVTVICAPGGMTLPHNKWHLMAGSYLNGWDDFGGGFGPGRWTVDSEGWIHLAGIIFGGTINAPAYQLPFFYAPPDRSAHPTEISLQFSRVDIDTSGNIIPGTIGTFPAGPGGYCVLDGISFPTY